VQITHRKVYKTLAENKKTRFQLSGRICNHATKETDKKKHIPNCDAFFTAALSKVNSRKSRRGFNGRVQRLAVSSLLAGFWLQCRILSLLISLASSQSRRAAVTPKYMAVSRQITDVTRQHGKDATAAANMYVPAKGLQVSPFF
jgi:hypothetical protein